MTLRFVGALGTSIKQNTFSNLLWPLKLCRKSFPGTHVFHAESLIADSSVSKFKQVDVHRICFSIGTHI